MPLIIRVLNYNVLFFTLCTTCRFHQLSLNDVLLTPIGNKTVKYGRRLIDTAAASLWNTLPIDIKNALKTVCFKKL